MKRIILGIAMASLSFTSCNSNNSSTPGDTVSNDTGKTVQVTSPVQRDSASIQPVVMEYLKLKNALVAGKSKDAADAGQALKAALDKLEADLMSETQKKAFTEIGDDSKEHAEHIGTNGDNIKHQREHFQMLSKDIYDFVKAFGSTQTLYKDYCPMVKAIWLSETKPIKNPYYGSSMLTCGQVQETIQQ